MVIVLSVLSVPGAEMDDNRMTILQSDTDITRETFTFLADIETTAVRRGASWSLSPLLSLMIVQGLSRINDRDNFLQLRPGYCGYSVGKSPGIYLFTVV